MSWQPRHAIADPLPRLSPALADAIHLLRDCAYRLEAVAPQADSEHRRAVMAAIADTLRKQADAL